MGAITAFVPLPIGTNGARKPMYKVVLSGPNTMPSTLKPTLLLGSVPALVACVKLYPLASPQAINCSRRLLTYDTEPNEVAAPVPVTGTLKTLLRLGLSPKVPLELLLSEPIQ